VQINLSVVVTGGQTQMAHGGLGARRGETRVLTHWNLPGWGRKGHAVRGSVEPNVFQKLRGGKEEGGKGSKPY